jgi:hypothetical protein
VTQRDVAQPFAGNRIADNEAFSIISHPQPADRRKHLPSIQHRRFRGEPLYQRITHAADVPGRIIISPLPEPDHSVIEPMIPHTRNAASQVTDSSRRQHKPCCLDFRYF